MVPGSPGEIITQSSLCNAKNDAIRILCGELDFHARILAHVGLL